VFPATVAATATREPEEERASDWMEELPNVPIAKAAPQTIGRWEGQFGIQLGFVRMEYASDAFSVPVRYIRALPPADVVWAYASS
jgi:hypothetical protein